MYNCISLFELLEHVEHLMYTCVWVWQPSVFAGTAMEMFTDTFVSVTVGASGVPGVTTRAFSENDSGEAAGIFASRRV